MEQKPQVLVFDAASGRAGEFAQRLRARGFTPVQLEQGTNGKPSAGNVAVILIGTGQKEEQAGELSAMLKRLVGEHVPTLVWGGGDGLRSESGPLVEWLASDVGLDELVGKVSTVARYVPLLEGLERELRHMQRLGQQLNRYFSEIDQEMRLAGRLQRDFLPRKLPIIPPYHFHVVYRPASWVSGDMYDVFRIDEHHIGMFVADAMGHGVAAGLLTMFLRQALEPKRVAGSSYSILTPGEVLDHLHQCLVRQKLPNCQFVTAAYGIIDTRRRELILARAGHPYPVHISPGGKLREVRIDGSLLGLADIPSGLEEAHIPLAVGDKVVIYTDGVEDEILRPRAEVGEKTVFTAQFQAWAQRSASGLVEALENHLDCREGSLHPADDVTVLTLEVA
ncbi:MAG: SpoIIE family protein phosphatase [Phycisphaerae bacterium]|nr:SpoIIE family protein phosphatase [Phycisphaerae bacterium]